MQPRVRAERRAAPSRLDALAGEGLGKAQRGLQGRPKYSSDEGRGS